jgi:hypothetical protein
MVLETAAFGENGAEDAAQARRVKWPGVGLDDGVEDGGLAGFIGNGQAVLVLEAADFGDGLGTAIDEAEKFEIEFVDDGALLLKGLGHGGSLLN